MRSIRDYNFSNKAVLVRVDFNLPIEGNKILDDFRIQRSLETIRYLQRQNARIVLLSHLGRPQNGQKQTLAPAAFRLEQLLKDKVKFVDDLLGRKARRAVKEMGPGDIVLLENLRNHKQEQENDKSFARSLVQLGEVFVQDAFSVCHREHSSVVSLPAILPHFSGLALERELTALAKISNNPRKPLVVIIGGAKVPSKMKVLKKFLETADDVLLGGKVFDAILRVKGITVGKPWPNEEVVKFSKELKLTNNNLHLPFDALVSPDKDGSSYIRETGPGNARKDEEIWDIGSETVRSFSNIISQAQTIFWSGPMGLVEQPRFSKGSLAIAEAITKNHSAFKVAGGGETVSFLRKNGLTERFSHLSMGGSAMLEYLAGEKLPGLEALD